MVHAWLKQSNNNYDILNNIKAIQCKQDLTTLIYLVTTNDDSLRWLITRKYRVVGVPQPPSHESVDNSIQAGPLDLLRALHGDHYWH